MIPILPSTFLCCISDAWMFTTVSCLICKDPGLPELSFLQLRTYCEVIAAHVKPEASQPVSGVNATVGASSSSHNCSKMKDTIIYWVAYPCGSTVFEHRISDRLWSHNVMHIHASNIAFCICSYSGLQKWLCRILTLTRSRQTQSPTSLALIITNVHWLRYSQLDRSASGTLMHPTPTACL